MMSKTLNFYPYYENILVSGKKTTTFRLNNRKGFRVGEIVNITIGWAEDKSKSLFDAQIKEVYEKEIGKLNKKDFAGESADCKSKESTIYVLGCIYKRTLDYSDRVTVIKFNRA